MNFLRKTRKFLLVSALITAWFFCGWLMTQEAQAAVSYIGVSNLITTNGGAPTAITPNASTQNGDLLVFYHYSRVTGGNETVSLTGFNFVFNSVTANYGLVAVGWRIKQSGDSTFTATITNHTSGNTGETVLEWIETYRGFDASTPIVNYTASLSTWASSLNIGPIAAPATATVHNGDMVVVFGGRFENMTAQTVLSGDSLTWATRTLNNTTLGSDASAVTQNGLNSSGSNQTVTAKTITTTGTAQVGAGRMFIIEQQLLPADPVISSSTHTDGAKSNVANATFTCSAGTPTPNHYHYLWDQTLTRTKAEVSLGTEWDGTALNKTCTSDGNWYLHAISHDASHVESANTDTFNIDYDGTAPQVNPTATAQSDTTVRIVYNEAVKHVSAGNSDDALNPSNYSIPLLTVSSVTYVSGDTTFDLTTTRQTPSQSYTITIINVQDEHGNVINPAFDEATFTGYGFPTVEARSSARTTAVDTTSHAITMPSGIQAGELLLVIFSVDGNPTCTDGSGLWAKLGQTSDAVPNVTGAIFYKIATGGDTLTITTSVAEQSSHIVLRISGAGEPTGIAATGSSTNSDPPLHNPGVALNYLWIATRSGDSTTTASAAPTNYSNLQTIAAVGTSSASSNTAERLLNASSEDPGTFTSANEQWVSYTISVPPLTPTITVASSTAQLVNIYIPSTGNNLGSFSIKRNSGTGQVTAVTLREWGDIDAQNDLENIKLWLSADDSLGGDTQLDTAKNFNGADGECTFTANFNVTTTTQYLIVTGDVKTGVTPGKTIEIQLKTLSTTDSSVSCNPGNYSEEQFKALDWVVYQAGLRNIRLMLVLVNNWKEYGGMRWYVDKSPTTAKTYKDVPDSDSNWWVYHDQFYTDTNCKNYYKNYVSYLLNRVNIYTGYKYKDDPRIFAWSLTNEGRAKSDGNRANLIFRNWVTEMSAYIKGIDTNHLVTTGIEGWGTPYEGTAFILDQDLANINFATYTLYPDAWMWFTEWSELSMADGGGFVCAAPCTVLTASALDWWTIDTLVSWDRYNTYEPPLVRYEVNNWVQQHVNWATTNLTKPVVMQEMGLKSTYSDALRNQFYQQAIHTFYNNGGDGLILWCLNHDNYYYSTDPDGKMDNGYGFYVSTDATLAAKSLAVINAIDFATTDNGGGSWVSVPTDMTNFVTRVTTPTPRFELNGSLYRFLGVNNYYLADYARDSTYDDDGNLISSSQQYVTEILNEAQNPLGDNSVQLNVIRTWAFGSGNSRVALGGQYNLFEIGSTPVDISGDTTVILPTLVKLASFNAIGYFGKVVVKWKTDSEMNNAGFNIYRSAEPKGHYVKINAQLILGLGSSAVGKEYEFWDNSVTDGITYYYKLEDVEFDGTSTMHGPVEAHPGLDSDGDGITDDWENYYGLNPHNPADASLDPDNDGFSNLEEFIQGTDPAVPTIPPVPPQRDEDGVKIIQSDDYGVILELSTSSFEVEKKVVDGQAYQVIKLPYVHGQTAEVGKPQVPVKGLFLGIPFDSSITIDAVSYEEEVFLGYNIEPVPDIHLEQEFPERRSLENGKIPGRLSHKFVKDTHTYSQNRFYPDCLAEVSPVGTLRGQDVAKLNIYPIQFNPVTGELKFCKRIRVEVDFGKKAEVDWGNIHKLPHTYNRLYKGLFHNYQDVKWWKRRPKRHIGPPEFIRRSAYKISIDEEGIYRLTWQDLYKAGLNPYGLNPRKIKLYNQEKEIPIYVAGEKDGRFDYDDYIEFYAEPHHSRYTSTNIYWLTTDITPGLRMKVKLSFGGRGETPASFLSRLHWEKDEVYWMEIPDKGYVDDHWFFAEQLLAPCSKDFTIPLSGVAPVEGEATIKLALQGLSYGSSSPDHHTRIYLNGHLVDDTTWDGDIEYIRELNVPQAYLVEGDNTITIELPGDTGAPFDIVLANWFEIHYRRQFKAEGNVLKFNNQGRGRYSYKISNFTENALEIFDITDPLKIKRIDRFDIKEEHGAYTVSFGDLFRRERNRDYIVLSTSCIKSPTSIVKDEPSNLRFRGNQADYIIITPEDFYDSVLRLAEHRTRGGLSVKVVKVSDIYDEFNYGIFSPEAIKTFLRFAYSEWSEPAPTYVLMVGDGTYDYRDNEGLGCKNYVPTYMVHSLEFGETGCDNWFVSLDGDDDILPDMFIGRLPVYSVGQLNTIVDKIINYETSPSDGWTKKVTLVADNLEAGIFRAMSEGLTGYLPPEYQTNKIYLDDYARPLDCKRDIIKAINQGTLILNYVGHASVVRWAHESILTIPDIPSLANLDRLPFISTMTCANGYFVYPPGFFNSMAEGLLYSPSGGAVAILAPTGISYPDVQKFLDQGLFESIFVEDNFLLGPATTQGRLKVFENVGEGGKNVIQTFLLFGDPALELKND